MVTKELQAFLNLMMVSDPWPLSPEARVRLEALAGRESRRRGYETWVEAHHSLSGAEIDEVLPRCAWCRFETHLMAGEKLCGECLAAFQRGAEAQRTKGTDGVRSMERDFCQCPANQDEAQRRTR